MDLRRSWIYCQSVRDYGGPYSSRLFQFIPAVHTSTGGKPIVERLRWNYDIFQGVSSATKGTFKSIITREKTV